MHSTNYVNTLILPSEDCRADRACAPTKLGSIAMLQFEVLGADDALTSDDILLHVTCQRREIPREEWELLRSEIFSKGQPCLRTSPLVKTFGWALFHDAKSIVSLIDPDSENFTALMDDDDVTKVNGMRSRRA